MHKFGLPVVVALNQFTSDTPAEFERVAAGMRDLGVETVHCTHWSDGAKGAEALAHAVAGHVAAGTARYAPLYPSNLGLAEKIRTIAREIYRAADVSIPVAIQKRLAGFETAGFGGVPVCIAKTQYSFSADPTAMGAPEGHVLPIREVRLSAGRGSWWRCAGTS